MLLSILLIVAVAGLSIALLIWNSRSGTGSNSAQLESLLTQAISEKRKGNFEHEEYLLNKALDLIKHSNVPDISHFSSCMVHLAEMYTQQGKFSQARDACARMLECWQQMLVQPSTSQLVELDYFVATANFGSGLLDVVDFYPKVIEAKKKIYGDVHEEIANAMILQSRLISTSGDKHRAEILEAEARAMLSTLQAPS